MTDGYTTNCHIFHLLVMRFLFVCFLLFFLLSNLSSFGQDTIYWKPTYKLKWADFQGLPDSSSTMTATSALEIEYILIPHQNGYYWQIIVFFKKSASWTTSKSTNLLLHEQIHFDLAELYARKIAKIFSTHKSTNSPHLVFNQVFDSIQIEFETEAKLYDKETNYSMNIAEQIRWKNKIKNEFKKYYLIKKTGYFRKGQ